VKAQTFNEELANTATHALGAILSIAALVILVAIAGIEGSARQVVSFSIYGLTLIALYLSSTLYHGFYSPRIKHIFKLADHSAIFLFIAGTYTPFALLCLKGTWRWYFLGIIWGFALFGILLTLLYYQRYRRIFTLLYLFMGWLGVMIFKPLLTVIPLAGVLWLVGGGVFYTLGVSFLGRKLVYGHAVWHVFVLAGSLCHFLGILFYVLPVS
jgi:hemolysin III